MTTAGSSRKPTWDPSFSLQTTHEWNSSSEHWRDRALCREVDPEMWYPEIGGSSDTREAKRICGECPVKEPCLEFALENDVRWGIWGGQSDRARAKMKSRARRNPPQYM